MKKLLLTISAILVINGIAFANNSECIKTLQEQQQKVINEISQTQQFIQQKQIEVLKLRGLS